MNGKLIFFVLIGGLFLTVSCGPQKQQSKKYLDKPFSHPGMLQSKADLDFLKESVLLENEPWSSAFERLKAETDISTNPVACGYVSVGAYGANSIGGEEFSSAAKQAYACALIWYVTNEKEYAERAIELLNIWSQHLWGFDGNNAKLNVGLFGQYYLNAAELLRNTDSGWKQDDIVQFERMLRTVYYPTIKDFFPEANGNWDGSMIYTMMCMGVFLDDYEMFDRAVERFYHGIGNGGITKYIYPGGQCQEATRDWGHVQLGLGEFAKACQVAWTQGLDLYSVADYRLAQGVEYAARFLLGYDVPVWGEISYRDMGKIFDIYYPIYHHYADVKGIDLPYTRMLDNGFEKDASTLIYSRQINRTVEKEASFGVLSGTRCTDKVDLPEELTTLQVEQMVKPSVTGALNGKMETSGEEILLRPGENIQKAINEAAGRWVTLDEGIHVLNEPLCLVSGTRLQGKGRGTVLMLAEKAVGPTIIKRENELSDVLLRNMLIEGATKAGVAFDPNHERNGRSYGNAPSREGIVLLADSVGQIKDICLENLTIRNFTKNGIFVSGAENVVLRKCDLDNNGSAVVPGPYFHHNLRVTRSSHVTLLESRFDSSLWGHGVELTCSENISVVQNEFARNTLSGIYCADVRHVVIENNLMEGNSQYGVVLDKMMDGCDDVKVQDNKLLYNSAGAFEIKVDPQVWADFGNVIE